MIETRQWRVLHERLEGRQEKGISYISEWLDDDFSFLFEKRGDDYVVGGQEGLLVTTERGDIRSLS